MFLKNTISVVTWTGHEGGQVLLGGIIAALYTFLKKINLLASEDHFTCTTNMS